MGIIKQRGLQLTVNTIADRNNIVKRPDHLVVHVKDAIADPLAGSGTAIYRWSEHDSKWTLISADVSHVHIQTEVDFEASAGQTTFSTPYTPGTIQVFIEGIKVKGSDFTATNGSSVVFGSGLDEGAWVQIVKFS